MSDDIDIRDPKFYADWTEEDLAAHIKRLQEILGLKQGYRPMPTKDLIAKILDPTTQNFLGTGMSMQDFYVAGRVRDIQNCILFQDREESRRRMDLLVEMAAELKKIREQTHFATRIAESALEDLIKGDWAGLRMLAQQFRFEDEDGRLRKKEGPVYARFSELCQKAFDTRPGAEDLKPAPKN